MKEQEEELNNKHKDLETLFNTIDDFLFILDTNGNIIYFNSTVTKRLGYLANELINQHVLMVHPPARHAEATQNINAMLMGTEKTCLVPLLTKNGNEIPVETIVMHGMWGGKKALFGISRDISDRVNYELKIQQNSERLEMALLATDAGLWDWNIKTGELTHNEKWFSMRGLAPAEINQNLESWEKLLHPDDAQKTIDALNLHLTHQTELYQAEYRTLTKSGKYIWILDTGKITEFDIDGKALRMVGTNIDISLKKESELNLQQNLKQQELLSDLALGLNTLNSFNQRINTLLSKIGEHTGVSRVYIFEDCNHGLETSNIYEWCNTGVAAQINDLQNIPYAVIPSWKKFLENEGRVYSEDISELPYDLREILEPQEIKSIIVYPLYVKGTFFGFIGFDECSRNKNWTKSELELLRTVSGIIANAYERKISEQSLTESEAKNRAILESIPDLLFNFDSEGRILNFQYSTKNDLAFNPDDYINKTVFEVFPHEIAHKIKAAIEKCLAENSCKLDYSIPIKNTLTDFEARMAKMNENEVIAIVRNVSERKEYERQLTKERDRANQANQAKSEFLANMSHEIRTPMNAILGFSEALYHKLDLEQHKKMLKSVLSSGNLLLSLLNDILDLSKIEAGKMEVSPQPIDFLHIIDEIKMLFENKANKKGIDIRTSFSENFPAVIMLDEIRIKQVVFNLIGNALKFTHKGHIQISAKFILTSPQKGTLELAIKDTGIGIPESQQELIFEAFRQQSGQSNRQYGGAGLGLAISKRLIEKMGGSIALYSELNQGSTFTLTFHHVETMNFIAREAESFDENFEGIVFENASILVVDDVNSNIETVESLLSDTRLMISSAENGEIALEILNHTNPDLILLDVRMPGIDGYEVARRIKENPLKKHIPIVAYTASVFGSDKVSKSPNFDSFLFKPARKSELYKQLMKYIKYTQQPTKMAKTLISQPVEELSPETKSKLPEILDTLNNKFLPKWEQIRDSFVLFEIEEFIEDLNKLARVNNFYYLDNYLNQLKEDVDHIDLESLKLNLIKFPGLINQISTLNEHND